jgi:hypothetical protein
MVRGSIILIVDEVLASTFLLFTVVISTTNYAYNYKLYKAFWLNYENKNKIPHISGW